jgi:non-specific serine/threonine protein kinase
MPQAFADVTGVRGHPGRTLIDMLVAALQPQHMLLVLDNCEHLVQACAELAEALLRACPQRRVLATSRELLGAAGETTWRMPSLSVPGATGRRSVDDTGRSEAVRLFLERPWRSGQNLR